MEFKEIENFMKSDYYQEALRKSNIDTIEGGVWYDNFIPKFMRGNVCTENSQNIAWGILIFTILYYLSRKDPMFVGAYQIAYKAVTTVLGKYTPYVVNQVLAYFASNKSTLNIAIDETREIFASIDLTSFSKNLYDGLFYLMTNGKEALLNGQTMFSELINIVLFIGEYYAFKLALNIICLIISPFDLTVRGTLYCVNGICGRKKEIKLN